MEALGSKEMFKEPPVYTEARISQVTYVESSVISGSIHSFCHEVNPDSPLIAAFYIVIQIIMIGFVNDILISHFKLFGFTPHLTEILLGILYCDWHLYLFWTYLSSFLAKTFISITHYRGVVVLSSEQNSGSGGPGFESWLCRVDIRSLGETLNKHFLIPILCKKIIRLLTVVDLVTMLD